jgi:hypothetical protein
MFYACLHILCFHITEILFIYCQLKAICFAHLLQTCIAWTQFLVNLLVELIFTFEMPYVVSFEVYECLSGSML